MSDSIYYMVRHEDGTITGRNVTGNWHIRTPARGIGVVAQNSVDRFLGTWSVYVAASDYEQAKSAARAAFAKAGEA